MVQHPAGLDDVENAADRLKLQNVGLRVLDIVQPQLARLSLGVTETGQAEIDGKHLRSCEASRSFDRMLAGAAAGDQDFRRALLADVAEIDQGKLTTEVGVNRRRLAYRRRLHPPWIGVFLVLLLDCKRHAVLD